MPEFEAIKFSEAYDLANEVWSHIVEWSPPESFDALLDPNGSETGTK